MRISSLSARTRFDCDWGHQFIVAKLNWINWSDQQDTASSIIIWLCSESIEYTI